MSAQVVYDERLAASDGSAACLWRLTPSARRYFGRKTDEFRHRVLATLRRRLNLEGSPVVLDREGETALIAHTAAVSPEDAAIVVSVAQLGDMPVPSEAVLERLYGLSPAEVRLAQGLARGDTLDDVAGELGIRITTARTQLASIFAKTDTRRQAKLVAILSHLAHLSL